MLPTNLLAAVTTECGECSKLKGPCEQHLNSLVFFVRFWAEWSEYGNGGNNVEIASLRMQENGWRIHEPNFRKSGSNGSCAALSEREELYPISSSNPPEKLIERLRNYERMHSDCLRGVSDWKGFYFSNATQDKDCKFVIHRDGFGGLGNRILAYMASFEFALLSNRVLLVDTSRELNRLFCNPIPNSSIWVPEGFPFKESLNSLRMEVNLKHVTQTKDLAPINSALAFLDWDAPISSLQFFCEKTQQQLQNIPWLVIQSGEYYGPGLLMSPSYATSAKELFPDSKISMWIARYLLLPHNSLWTQIRTVLGTKLRAPGSQSLVGVQVRELSKYSPGLAKRLVSALSEEGIVPLDPVRKLPVTVFLTSLEKRHFRDVKSAYSKAGLLNTSWLRLHYEENVGYENHSLLHNLDALKEMFLLSMADKLVISSFSTFGYVASALRGEGGSFVMRVRNAGWRNRKLPFIERLSSSNACYNAFPVKLACTGDNGHPNRTLMFGNCVMSSGKHVLGLD